jgi:hypothetical protein
MRVCALVLFGALAIAAGDPPARATTCVLPTEKRMTVAHLFFGRSIPGRIPLTDAEWATFAAHELSRDFPDGFTVFDGDGQWLDPSSGAIVRERSKIVIVAAGDDDKLARRLSAAARAYEKEFRQKSVGIMTEPTCAEF